MPLRARVREILRVSYVISARILFPLRLLTLWMGHPDLAAEFDVVGVIFYGALVVFWMWATYMPLIGDEEGLRGTLARWYRTYHLRASTIVYSLMSGFGRLTSGTGLHALDALFWSTFYATLLLTSWMYGPRELAGEFASPIAALSFIWCVAYLDTRFAHLMITTMEGCPHIVPWHSSSTALAPSPDGVAAFPCILPEITRTDRIVVAGLFFVLFIYSVAVILVPRVPDDGEVGGGGGDPRQIDDAARLVELDAL